MPTLTQQGINALKLGNRQEAQKILKSAIAQNPQDIQAWLWLSGAVDSNQERLRCLKEVLAIDPENSVAAKGLAKLVANGAVQIQHKETEVASEVVDKPTTFVSQKSIPERERVVFQVKPSIVPFIVAVILMTLLLVGALWMVSKTSNSSTVNLMFGFFFVLMFGAGYWKIGIAFLKSLFARYTLTTKHLIVKTGILSRSQKTIPLQKIQDVSFEQQFLLRPFGVGNVIVESAGERGEIKLFALADCPKKAKQILQVVERFH